MRTTPSCSEQWARRSHASPAPFSHHSSVACPHKAANRTGVHKNPIIPSLAEAHYSHGVTAFGDTPAVAEGMEFPWQPCEETQQLCGVKVTAPRCCPHSTWQDKFHASIVPDTSLFECTSTEREKKIRARKMAFKYVKPSARFLSWRWRATPHNPIKVTRRTEWRQLIIKILASVQRAAGIWVLLPNSEKTVT
ncbi:hypothetical protein TcCL_Unassigned01792 [Trypanosoma cruzi]|nr:hypothetical protein TcCL_Unassigned01792 [Trypanosoma cruzi]